jgi:D-beta-D-heptose 7-phosphate kinase/D-beta-D-heptose 1-phosphate adenosyltransferase
MASALGADVTLWTAVSRELNGIAASMLGDACVQYGFATQARTSVKTRFVEQSRLQQLLRQDDDACGEIVDDWSKYPDVSSYQAVLIADYGKGYVTRRLLDALIGKVAPVIVDPYRHAAWTWYHGVQAIKCNDAEAEGKRWSSAGGADVIVTHGAKGMSYCTGGSILKEFPARPRRIIDVCGAGDMVLAALGVCIAGGLSWPDACEVANAAAGLKVERFGAIPVDRADIVADLAGADPLALSGCKSVPTSHLLDALAAHRAAGRKIVFTNGCFDIFHAGHAACLREAKAQGDVLVVGLNSDGSVRRLKGEGRPVQSERNRSAVLESMECVDYVVRFHDDTPANLIASIKPDVLVKGSDWRPRAAEIAGREHAGRLHFVEHYGGLTSSKIAEAIAAA